MAETQQPRVLRRGENYTVGERVVLDEKPSRIPLLIVATPPERIIVVNDAMMSRGRVACHVYDCSKGNKSLNLISSGILDSEDTLFKVMQRYTGEQTE